MSSRRTRLIVAGVAALGVVGMALPAQAGDTTVTFQLTAGLLTIDTPTAPAQLATGGIATLAGASVVGTIGSTTVNDVRGGVTGWNSTIKGTDFSNGTTTIPVGSAKGFVAVTDALTGLVSSTGVVTATALPYVSADTGLALTTAAQPFIKATAVVGNNTATFTPSLNVAIPSNATAGTYSGTVTQTVS